ncbi:GTP-binding family protein [Artemisia annua]|uniref:GTP-binding family protein n=1 Tax=Artemisia annua TaxID=35608 RepID=A0A2U1QKI4_ARTAN|nr:GTP-binding family protein [Artemisia annua]
MVLQVNPKQTRILCMNKVDLVEKKKHLLMVVDQFKDLPEYEGKKTMGKIRTDNVRKNIAYRSSNLFC